MTQLNYQPTENGHVLNQTKARQAEVPWTKTWWFRLLALLLFTELIMPFLLWQAGLPRSMDFIKELVAGVVVMLVLIYMLVRNRIPMVMLLVIGISLIWGMLAMLDGQSWGATAWGLWRLFKYPLIGLFAYLIPNWPDDFARWFTRFCVILLTFEVAFQGVQYALGQPLGDSLAGTFGWKGVGGFTMLVLFTVCIALGNWIVTGDWKTLVYVLVLGLVGSMLNLTKFYIAAIILLALVAVMLHMIRGGRFRRLFVFILLFAAAIATFVPVYNRFVADNIGLRPLQDYLERDALESYLFNDGKGDIDGLYNLGRGLSVEYAWQQIQRDFTTTLFGFGLGSRTTSTSLGLTGVSLESDIYGGAVNETGLGSWIQEYGLIGTALLVVFMLWVAYKLIQYARTTPDRQVAALGFGLALFTLFWPVWLWYHKPWVIGVMPVLYWVALGYAFQQVYRPRRPRQGQTQAQTRNRVASHAAGD